jgi:hypothetical protein
MEVSQRFQWSWLHRGMDLAMRVTSLRNKYRAWYVIHPLDANCSEARAASRSSSRPGAAGDVQLYQVRCLEALRQSIAQILQREDADVRCLEEFFAYGDWHLGDCLGRRGLSIATFYPLNTAAVYDDHGVPALRPARL